jgi:hypothetical protein
MQRKPSDSPPRRQRNADLVNEQLKYDPDDITNGFADVHSLTSVPGVAPVDVCATSQPSIPFDDIWYVSWTGNDPPSEGNIAGLKGQVCERIRTRIQLAMQKASMQTTLTGAYEDPIIEHVLFQQKYYNDGELVSKHRLLIKVRFDPECLGAQIDGSRVREILASIFSELHVILSVFAPPPLEQRSMQQDRFEIYRPHFFALEALMEKLPDGYLAAKHPRPCVGTSFLDLTGPGFSGQYFEDRFFPQIQRAMRNLVHFTDDFSRGNIVSFGDATGTQALKKQARRWNFEHTSLSDVPERFDGFDFKNLRSGMETIIDWIEKNAHDGGYICGSDAQAAEIEGRIQQSVDCRFLQVDTQDRNRNRVYEGRIVAFGPKSCKSDEAHNYFHVLSRRRDSRNLRVWHYYHNTFLADPENSSNPPRQLAPLGKAEIWANHDIVSYVCTGTPFAYVLPLCFKRIQQGIKAYTDQIQKNAVLACVPPASPDLRAASMLDWYFDYDLSLEDLMDGKQPARREVAEHGKTNRHNETNYFRERFEELLFAFRQKIHKLRNDNVVKQAETHAGVADACIWCERDEFSMTGKNPGTQGAWLGLGQVLGGFRRPVAIKRGPIGPINHGEFSQEDLTNYKKFVEVMNLLNPSGYIASATRGNVFHCATGNQAHLSPERPPSPGDDPLSPGRALKSQPRFADDEIVGIGCTLITDTNHRIYISRVKSGGGAEAAGIRPGDRLVAVNKQEVKHEEDAKRLILGRVGETLELELSRSKREGFIGRETVIVQVTRLRRLYRRWVSEVGICTLDELFQTVSGKERGTQAFRMLLREVIICVSFRSNFNRLVVLLTVMFADFAQHGNSSVKTA